MIPVSIARLVAAFHDLGIISNFLGPMILFAPIYLLMNIRGSLSIVPFIVDDYKKILVIGCEEASKWSASVPTLHVNTNLEPASLEEELQIQGQPIHVLDFCSCPPMSLRELILN
jgi:hypothetical protein